LRRNGSRRISPNLPERRCAASCLSFYAWLSVKEVKSAFAKHHGVNRAYLNVILNGKKPVTDFIAEAVGVHKVYIAKKSAKN
jgi:hypothetical protein